MSNNAENRFENNAVVLAGEVAGTPVRKRSRVQVPVTAREFVKLIIIF